MKYEISRCGIVSTLQMKVSSKSFQLDQLEIGDKKQQHPTYTEHFWIQFAGYMSLSVGSRTSHLHSSIRLTKYLVESS